MTKRNILECMTLVGSTPSTFEGEKQYVSTGAVDCDHICTDDVELVSYDNRPSRANLTASEGDILFAKMCATEKTLLLDSELADNIYSTGFCAVRAIPSVISTECLYHLLASEQFLLQKDKNCSGATQKAITNAGLAKIFIQVPSIEEQSHLAKKLSIIKELIAKRQEELIELDNIIKSRFIEMFGDFKINSMKWTIKPFTEFAEIDGNMTTDYEKYADYPHIGIDSIEKGTGELKGYRTVREDGVISGKYIFTPKHIIYSKIRPNLNKVALPNFVGLCSADAYPILPKQGKCNRTFLAIAMRSSYFLDYILQFSNRTNLPKVNRKELSGFCMPLPPIDLQNEFATFVESTDKLKFEIKKSLEELEILKKSLMQQYFG